MPFDVQGSIHDTAIVLFLVVLEQPRTASFTTSRRRKNYFHFQMALPLVVPIESIRNDPLSRLSVVLSQKAAPVLANSRPPPLAFRDWFRFSVVCSLQSKEHSEEQISKRFLHATFKAQQEYLPELQGNELSRYWIGPERASFLRYVNDIASNPICEDVFRVNG